MNQEVKLFCGILADNQDSVDGAVSVKSNAVVTRAMAKAVPIAKAPVQKLVSFIV
jgi:hypothetical protein